MSAPNTNTIYRKPDDNYEPFPTINPVCYVWLALILGGVFLWVM